MKRIVGRVVVAAVTFGFAVAVDRVVDSRLPAPESNKDQTATTMNLPASIPTFVPACPAAMPFPLPAVSPTPRLLFDYNPAKFNPRGTYYPLHRLPQEFAEFDLFELAVEFDGRVSGSAGVQTRVDGMYDYQDADFVFVTERRLFFITAPRYENDVAYRFEGEFLSNPARRLDSGKAVVHGTLRKTRSGRTIAQTQATFDVKYLGC